ncbi:hypothetical protein DQP57_00295 [Mycobacterium colombiense]|uniref:Uncharacterized protein n=1 Tax=Mycobacterium colombiense TaxID=339268 RepID=A0A329MBQ5_9MYCO|nr:hypothetical protein [Mycobacterium colombiense]RAV17499.1 hypothetical protein DQP57_00295 [Mycobacterium colombiense]
MGDIVPNPQWWGLGDWQSRLAERRDASEELSEYQDDPAWQTIYEALMENATDHWPADAPPINERILTLLNELVVPDADRVFEALREAEYV